MAFVIRCHSNKALMSFNRFLLDISPISRTKQEKSNVIMYFPFFLLI